MRLLLRRSRLPFGLKSSPGIWERYASLAEWILKRRGIKHVIHYVDDFLVGGEPKSRECANAVALIRKIFAELNIPINTDKLALEGTPSTTVKVLGILIDTVLMQARLDPERLAAIKAALAEWSAEQTCSRQELQSLIGTLAFAAKVVPAGRTFLRRLLATLCAAHKHRSASVALGPAFHSDLAWWRRFISEWNGIALLYDSQWSPPGTLSP